MSVFLKNKLNIGLDIQLYIKLDVKLNVKRSSKASRGSYSSKSVIKEATSSKELKTKTRSVAKDNTTNTGGIINSAVASPSTGINIKNVKEEAIRKEKGVSNTIGFTAGFLTSSILILTTASAPY